MAEESRRLDSAPTPIHFSNGTIIEGLGGSGLVHQQRPDSGRLRSATLPGQADTSAAFERALAKLGIREQETISLEATEVRGGAGDRLTLRPAIGAGDGAPRVVLYQDESGGVSWHFAAAADTGSRRGLRAATPPPVFVIPLRSAQAQASLRGGLARRSLRGPLAVVGRKIFKVLILPVLSSLLGDPLRWFAEQVEQRHRPQFLWQPTPDNYRRPPPAGEATVDWSRLRAGPVLLLVHGIFSTVEGMLAGLPRSALQRWYERYEGRVLAFNHPTVSVSPEDNARQLLAAIQRQPPGEPLVFDILCHSRGGIVARTLAERGAELVPESACRFRSIHFLATPNAGSPLGDAEHLRDLIDLYTNCLSAFPDEPATYSAEVLLGLVTLAVYAITDELPGIAALGMRRGYIVDTLNRNPQRSPALYSAAAADFEPQPGRDNGWLLARFGPFSHLADSLMDRVFTLDGKEVANDLVVPTDGVFAANGHPSFPIADQLRFDAADGVWHTAFFAEARTIAHIDAHFERVRQVALARRLRFHGRTRVASGDESRDESGDESDQDSREGQSPAHSLRRRRSPAGADDTLTSDPQLDFCERLEAGASADLVVRLELPSRAATAAGRMTLAFASGSDEIELVAEVSAPGFRVDGQRHATLCLRRERDPATERATFRLTALDPGSEPVERTIVVSFFRGNDCVGGITHPALVVPRGHQDDQRLPQNRACRSDTLRVSRQPREAADLVVCLRRQQIGRDVFELSLRSQIPGAEYEAHDFGCFDLDGKELASYLADALDPSFDRFPGGDLAESAFDAALAAWNADFLTTLADLGKQLWLHLPPAFRAEYLRLMGLDDPPRSLFVFSDELSFPWEIVRPSGEINGAYRELPPLGVAHLLGRWQPGTGARPQPQALPVNRMVIVVPDAAHSGLPWAADEVRQLRALLPFAERLTPVTRRQVGRLLDDGDAQLVHFSGHGAVGANADLTALELEGGESISAMAFAASRLGSTRQPLLFLNACTVGRGGRVLGRAGGFAGNCIEAGWSGIVAPYWPVLDSSASAFGVAFYRKLKAGRSIGEALGELRSEASDDPTALAYAYFGDPFARVLFA